MVFVNDVGDNVAGRLQRYRFIATIPALQRQLGGN